MKKKNIIRLITFVLILNFSMCLFSGCKVSIPENAEIMIRGAKFDYEPLNDEEANTIREILGGKNTFYDNGLSCPFYEEVSIKIGNDIFMPACDDCDIVKVNNSYNISISDGERDKLEQIFENHGQTFPYLL